MVKRLLFKFFGVYSKFLGVRIFRIFTVVKFQFWESMQTEFFLTLTRKCFQQFIIDVFALLGKSSEGQGLVQTISVEIALFVVYSLPDLPSKFKRISI